MVAGLLLLWGAVGASAQVCNRTDWFRLALFAHEGPLQVYHGGIGRVVRFEGDMWGWDGASWARVGPIVTAGDGFDPPRAMAYDPVRDRIVGIFPNNTREWDGTGWIPRGGLPTPVRIDFAMAFDPNLGQVVLVGGMTPAWPNPTVLHGDMWAWNGSAWMCIVEHAVTPRFGHTMHADPATGRLLLFGGKAAGSVPSPETWAWDGAGWWLVSSSGPVDEQPAFMYADGARARILHPVTGAGVDPTGPATMHEWTGTAWAALPCDIPARRNPGVAFEATRGRLVVSGGRTLNNVPIAQTWEHDGSMWVRAWDREWLPASGHSMAYDRGRDQIVCFDAPQGRTLLFDGQEWQAPKVPGPGVRSFPAMCFDATRRVVVLHGGWNGVAAMSDTWEWDGQVWRLVSPAGPAASGDAMDYDPASGRCVLVTAGGGLWAWDGLNWELLAAGAPVGWQPALVVDRARGRVVVHPASPCCGRTAEWDGLTWHVPGAFSWFVGAAPLEFDEGREQPVLFGGMTVMLFPEPGPNNLAAAYSAPEWQPFGSWHPIHPAARVNHPMVYDSRRDRLVIFGGMGHRDMWTNARTGNDPPVWTIQPVPTMMLLPGNTLQLTASTTNVSGQVAPPPDRFQWRRDGEDLEDGPSALGTISGARGHTLVITGVTVRSSGSYDCVAENDCGQVVSTPSVVSVRCRADLTTGAVAGQPGYGKPDGRVTTDDFFYYLAAFAAGNLGVADITTTGAPTPGLPGHGVPDGRLDNDDFIAYLTRYSSTC